MVKRTVFADDDTVPFVALFRLRLPSLILGLILGISLSFVTSQFEAVLANNIEIAFFIPLVVYLASAVGSQTYSIYSRDLKSGKADFKGYLLTESKLGILFGLIFSIITAPIVYYWLQSVELMMTVSLSIVGAIFSAPIIALIVSQTLNLDHKDPAVGSGPIATVIQDTLSVMIYGLIASAILL